MAVPSSWKGVAAKGKEEDNESIISDYGVLMEKEDESEDEKGDGSESDSSIDIHTPLPYVPFPHLLTSLLKGMREVTLCSATDCFPPVPSYFPAAVLRLCPCT